MVCGRVACRLRTAQPGRRARGDRAVHGGRRVQGRRGDDAGISHLARGCLRPLPRCQPAGIGRTVSSREHEAAVARRIRQDHPRRAAGERHAELEGEQAGRGQSRSPVCLPQGALRRRHHARQGRAAQMIRACLRSAARSRCWRASLALAVLVTAAALEPSSAQQDVLRVCQDPNNLPFSNHAGQGFENKIAELLARELGWKLEYFSFPQRMGFIRNTLRFKLPREQYRCDLVIGVPADYDQVWATRPYYHSTYVLIYPQGGKLEGVHTGKDLDAAIARDQLAGLRIGVFDRSPASEWLVKHGLLEQAV